MSWVIWLHLCVLALTASLIAADALRWRRARPREDAPAALPEARVVRCAR